MRFKTALALALPALTAAIMVAVACGPLAEGGGGSEASPGYECKPAPLGDPTYYGVWVNGVQFSDGHKRIICGSGTADFDPDTSTLTLTNATIDTGCVIPESWATNTYGYAGIFTLINLRIVLHGENLIAIDGGVGIDTCAQEAAFPNDTVVSSISVEGPGTLGIRSDDHGMWVSGQLDISDTLIHIASVGPGIYVKSNFTATGSAVAIESDSSTGIEIVSGSALIDSSLVVGNNESLVKYGPGGDALFMFGFAPLEGTPTQGYNLHDGVIVAYDPSAGPFEPETATGIVSSPADAARWVEMGSEVALYVVVDGRPYSIVPDAVSAAPVAYEQITIPFEEEFEFTDSGVFARYMFSLSKETRLSFLSSNSACLFEIYDGNPEGDGADSTWGSDLYNLLPRGDYWIKAYLVPLEI